MQVVACLLGALAGLVPCFSQTRPFWGLYTSQVSWGDVPGPLRIHRVDAGSAAERAGFRVGDVVQHDGGFDGFNADLRHLATGDRVTFRVERAGSVVPVEAVGLSPALAAVWYAHLFYPIAGGLFLAMGLMVFATAPIRPAPWWRSISVALLGFGLAVGFAVVLATASVWTRLMLWSGFGIDGGVEWSPLHGAVGFAAGLALAVLGAAELRQRLSAASDPGPKEARNAATHE